MQGNQRSGVGGGGLRSVRSRAGQGGGDAALETDLQSAFHQIEGHHGRVCGATAQNPTKATQHEVLRGAKFNFSL